jgi:DNA polymerase-3 subunit beta
MSPRRDETERKEQEKMKVTIPRAELLRGLGHVQSVVERRNTIPVLSNVLIEAKSGSLTVTATDLDLQVRETIEATIETAGRTTVSAHTLHDIVRKMPDGDVTLDHADGRMLVRAGRARFTLPTLPSDDFPEIPVGDMTHRFTIPSKVLSAIISSTRFAMSSEETRYYLNGIFLHIKQTEDGPHIAAAATDGHRLSLAMTAIVDGSADIPSVIVPRKCVGEIHKILDSIDVDVKVALSVRKIEFDFGSLVYLSKVVDGTYPEYQRVIPTGNDKIVVVPSDVLAESIDRMSVVATEKTRAVKIGVEKGRMVLSVTSPDNGTATEEVEVEYDGPSFEIGFNSRYLLDILAQTSGQDVEIQMKDSVAPALFRLPASKQSLCVLMPMRV